MRLLKSIFLIINYKTFIVTVLAVSSTILCQYYNLRANFPLTIVGIAIVFPVVFSIDSAYRRRERILMLLSDFKGHLNAIYMASRDWVNDGESGTYKNEMKNQLIQIYDAVRHLCCNTKETLNKREQRAYQHISDLSLLVQKFRKMDLHLGELSRVNQYISKLVVDVENIKVIRQYRSPVTLRAYSRVFIFSFPILYGPYFAYAAQEYSPGLEYFMPIIFSFILVSLDNIQEHLEDPFDQIGEDDVKFDVEEFSEYLN